MTVTDITTSIGIVGSGFSPSGGVSFITSCAGQNSYFGSTVTSTGGISYTIAVSAINNLASATAIQLWATDEATMDNSNTIVIPVNVTQVSPTLTYSGGTVYLTNSGGTTTTNTVTVTYSPSVSITESGTNVSAGGNPQINFVVTGAPPNAQAFFTVGGGGPGVAGPNSPQVGNITTNSSGGASWYEYYSDLRALQPNYNASAYGNEWTFYFQWSSSVTCNGSVIIN